MPSTSRSRRSSTSSSRTSCARWMPAIGSRAIRARRCPPSTGPQAGLESASRKAGCGVEIALACDLRCCSASAQFGIPAAKLGLGYNIEGHKRLLETVGHARAREIMFLGRRYDAAEAFAMGLVHRVLPDGELERYTSDVINTLCENAPLSIANTKTILEEYVKAEGAPDPARMRAAIEGW